MTKFYKQNMVAIVDNSLEALYHMLETLWKCIEVGNIKEHAGNCKD